MSPSTSLAKRLSCTDRCILWIASLPYEYDDDSSEPYVDSPTPVLVSSPVLSPPVVVPPPVVDVDDSFSTVDNYSWADESLAELLRSTDYLKDMYPEVAAKQRAARRAARQLVAVKPVSHSIPPPSSPPWVSREYERLMSQRVADSESSCSCFTGPPSDYSFASTTLSMFAHVPVLEPCRVVPTRIVRIAIGPDGYSLAYTRRMRALAKQPPPPPSPPFASIPQFSVFDDVELPRSAAVPRPLVEDLSLIDFSFLSVSSRSSWPAPPFKDSESRTQELAQETVVPESSSWMKKLILPAV